MNVFYFTTAFVVLLLWYFGMQNASDESFSVLFFTPRPHFLLFLLFFFLSSASLPPRHFLLLLVCFLFVFLRVVARNIRFYMEAEYQFLQEQISFLFRSVRHGQLIIKERIATDWAFLFLCLFVVGFRWARGLMTVKSPYGHWHAGSIPGSLFLIRNSFAVRPKTSKHVTQLSDDAIFWSSL